MVSNNGLSWEMKVPTHHQLMIYDGPLMSRNSRMDHNTAHLGGSVHEVDVQQMDGELQLFHYHIQ